MAQFTQEQLEQLLKTVLEGVNPNTFGDKYTAYARLYPEGVGEGDVAKAVRKFPQLHPLMVQLVEQLVDLPEYPVWIDDEEQAGTLLSLALALYDKKYCELLAECLVNQDLDHEVYQNEYIEKVFRKWGACEETALLIQARIDNPGQHGPEIVDEMLGEYEELAEFLEDDEDDDWDEDEDEEDEEPVDILAPVVTVEQIQAAQEAQLQQHYADAGLGFVREITDCLYSAINQRSNKKAAIAVLRIALDVQRGATQITVLDAAENAVSVYQRQPAPCLAPFACVCERLGYSLQERALELLNMTILPSLQYGAFDAKYTESCKFEVC